MTTAITPEPGVTIMLRENEIFEHLRTSLAAGDLCTYCAKPIVEGTFRWEDWPLVSEFGNLNTFPDWRHADGSAGHGEDGHLVLPKSDRCPECKRFDVLDRRDTGYGDDVTCRNCGWNKYFDRGD